MFKRQADMNYAAKYRNLNHWGVQSTKALMKVLFFHPLSLSKIFSLAKEQIYREEMARTSGKILRRNPEHDARTSFPGLLL